MLQLICNTSDPCQVNIGRSITQANTNAATGYIICLKDSIMGQQLAMFGYDEWTNPRDIYHEEFRLHEFNVLISAIELFME